MRQIIIKTTTSENHKRKNLFITEMLEQNGITAKAEKKYSYYVSEQKPDLSKQGLPQIVSAQQLDYHKKDRHVSIRKTYDPATGSGQMIYRVIGSFYVVQNLHIFAVVFMHSVKFDLPATSLGKHITHGDIHIDPIDFNIDADTQS